MCLQIDRVDQNRFGFGDLRCEALHDTGKDPISPQRFQRLSNVFAGPYSFGAWNQCNKLLLQNITALGSLSPFTRGRLSRFGTKGRGRFSWASVSQKVVHRSDCLWSLNHAVTPRSMGPDPNTPSRSSVLGSGQHEGAQPNHTHIVWLNTAGCT